MKPNLGAAARVPAPTLLALLGAVGGWVSSQATLGLGGGFDCGEAVVARPRPLGPPLVFVLSTAAVCFGLGWVLRRQHRRPSWVGRALGYALVAGMINGVVVGAVSLGPAGIILGTLFGLFCSLPFLPAVVLVMWSMQAIGLSRQRSIVDAAQRRAPWSVTAAILAVVIALAGLPSGRLLVASCLAVAGVLAAFDVAALVRIARLQTRLGSMRSLSESGPATIDLGVGEELHAELDPAGTPFRSLERPTFILRGDLVAAHGAIQRALALDTFLVTLIVAALALFQR